MNWEIIFSTYVNQTGDETPRKTLERDLVAMANVNHIQGFSLREQTGFWAGELEASYVLELLDTSKAKAFHFGEQLKSHFKQDAVIIREMQTTTYFI